MENKIKIFLVDDNLFTLNIYNKELDDSGYEDVSLFLNGTLCLNNLHQKPNVIFLDHNMDDVTGFEALKKIKRFDPNIFVVIVSAQDEMKIAVDALKYGAFDYIIKGEGDVVKMKKVLAKISEVRHEISQARPSIIKKILSIF